jgi:outer membrane biosynthesis protein TonB
MSRETFPNCNNNLVKYYLYQASIASATQSEGWGSPKCNGSYLKDNYGYETGSSSVHERENKNKKKPILKLIQKGKEKKKKEKRKRKNKQTKLIQKKEREKKKEERKKKQTTPRQRKRLLEETDKARDAKDVITSSLSFIFYYASANLFVRTGQQPESHQPLFIFYTQ